MKRPITRMTRAQACKFAQKTANDRDESYVVYPIGKPGSTAMGDGNWDWVVSRRLPGHSFTVGERFYPQNRGGCNLP